MEDFGLAPAAGGPVLNSIFEPYQSAADQRAIDAFGSAEWRHSPTVSHDPSGARAGRACAQHLE
jgi:hypothetical protein